MTIASAESADRQDNSDLIRWAVSLLLVLVFHFVAALWLLSREAPVEPNKPPPPAALLDLPPLPLAGAGGPAGMPAPPKPKILEAPPPKPPAQEVKPIVPPQPEHPPKLTVPLPVPPKPLPPKTQPLRPQPPKAAPEPSQPSGSAAPVTLDPVRAWQLGVIKQIEKFKNWPPEAVSNRLTGIVGLRIEIDRQGNILAYSLAASSGFPLLDAATLEMARKARHLPALPPEIPEQFYAFTLSVQWF